MAVMHKTGYAGFIHDHLGGHAAQFEQVYFLPVELEHAGFGVRQADKGQVVLAKIGRKGIRIFRADHNHFGPVLHKFWVILTQLRHMPLAEWSGESAVEYQQYIVLAKQVRKAEGLAFVVRQGEIRGWCIDAYLGHVILI